ncbi:hypothetical protein LCGC14_0495030 [marine sediment metagenome]|uniref:Uncharacterized protein n=1 Tax=marine sediment metagenome TaxID=412755 RepID=A0A0F9USD0_9ZZZZ
MWLLGRIVEFKKMVDNISPGIYKINAITLKDPPFYELKEIIKVNKAEDFLYIGNSVFQTKTESLYILAHKIEERRSLKLPIVIKRAKKLVEKLSKY